jgi:hypothetical protein
VTRRDLLDGFWPNRSLEDAAFVQGVIPTSLLAVLFPVWCVEVEATVTKGEPYALIEPVRRAHHRRGET